MISSVRSGTIARANVFGICRKGDPVSPLVPIIAHDTSESCMCPAARAFARPPYLQAVDAIQIASLHLASKSLSDKKTNGQ
jgi:hypothetical protein